MQTLRYIYYGEDGFWLGWLEQFPDYRTQGESLVELEENLRDLYPELTAGTIPGVRQVGTPTIP